MRNIKDMHLYSKTIHVKYKSYDIYAIRLGQETTIQKIYDRQKIVFDHAKQKFDDVKKKFPFTKVGVSKFF